jgi:hypothetical protein
VAEKFNTFRVMIPSSGTITRAEVRQWLEDAIWEAGLTDVEITEEGGPVPLSWPGQLRGDAGVHRQVLPADRDGHAGDEKLDESADPDQIHDRRWG